MAKSENKGELDRSLIERALNAFKIYYGDDEPAPIPPYLFDQAKKEGFNLEGFIRRCPRKGEHGNGAKRLARGYQKKEKANQPILITAKEEEPSIIKPTKELPTVSIGCTAGVYGQAEHAAFLEQLKDLRIFAMRWAPYRQMLVRRQ